MLFYKVKFDTYENGLKVTKCEWYGSKADLQKRLSMSEEELQDISYLAIDMPDTVDGLVQFLNTWVSSPF